MRKIACEEFGDEVLRSHTPVMVLFTNSWCGSAYIVKGVLEEVLNSYSGRFDCIEVNEDECDGIFRRYGIIHIPTILIFSDSEIVEQIKGVPSRESIENTLNNLLIISSKSFH